MHLHIPTMDAVLVDFTPDGRVRLLNEDWTKPTRQEIRAIIHAAEAEREQLKELIDTLEAATRLPSS
jgi:hypothetical protein